MQKIDSKNKDQNSDKRENKDIVRGKCHLKEAKLYQLMKDQYYIKRDEKESSIRLFKMKQNCEKFREASEKTIGNYFNETCKIWKRA